jgi:hypothetical protein
MHEYDLPGRSRLSYSTQINRQRLGAEESSCSTIAEVGELHRLAHILKPCVHEGLSPVSEFCV